MSLVKFKTSSEAKMTKVDSMTVFNTEEVETTKQPMFFVILVLGVLMNSLIFKDTPSKQQRSLHEQDVHLVSDISDSHTILPSKV